MSKKLERAMTLAEAHGATVDISRMSKYTWDVRVRRTDAGWVDHRHNRLRDQLTRQIPQAIVSMVAEYVCGLEWLAARKLTYGEAVALLESAQSRAAARIHALATGDSRVTGYMIAKPGAPSADAYVELQPTADGGYNIWHTDYATGMVCRTPTYRPDAASARVAAWGILLDLLADFGARGRLVRICSGEDLLAEAPALVAALQPAAA